jgi:NADH-quinone oxidoreductase subunit L
VILAFFSIFAGWLGFPHSLGGKDRFARYLDPVFAKEARVFEAEGRAGQLQAGEKEEEHTSSMEYVLMFLSIGAGLAGWGVAWKYYRHADKGYVEPLEAKAAPVYRTLLNKYYVDEAYDVAFTGRRKAGSVRLGALGIGEGSSWFDSQVIDGTVNGAGWITRVSGAISSWWDKWIIDGIGVNGPAIIAQAFSYPARIIQWGLVQWYALVMTVGLVGFVAYYVWK